jgi:hypothetical protein
LADLNPPVTNKLSEADAKYLGEIYRQKRYQAQIDFYDARISEYNYNSNLMFYVSSSLMIFSGLLSTLNLMIGPARELSVFVTLLPALAALLGAFNQIYDWDRQASLYVDAYARLARLDGMSIGNHDDLLDFVGKAEFVFRSEGDQWGQTISEQKTGNPSGSPADTGK